MALKNKTHEIEPATKQRPPRQIALNSPEHEHPFNPVAALQRATSGSPSALRPADIFALQRTIGNRAVQRMLNNQPHALSAQSATPANAIQRQTEEEEEPLQGKFEAAPRTEKMLTENRTGLPDGLKAGIENLSGLAMDDVRVHYNSSKPAEMHALAYTQGRDIHVAPGQERHLPHEAWHVVQQRQGRVRPTFEVRGVAINDNEILENEADVMGTRVNQPGVVSPQREVLPVASAENTILQRMNLEQANLKGALSDEGKRFLVGDNKEVNLYGQEAAGLADNKVKALQKAGEMNAVTGNTVDAYAEDKFTKEGLFKDMYSQQYNTNYKWTGNSADLNKQELPTIDPFFFAVRVPFKGVGKDNKESKESLELVFQHAKNWTGYVEAIYDSTNPETVGVPTMYEEGDKNLKQGQDHHRNLKFSNKHATGDYTKLIDQTVGKDEKNLDAYTKIAGEGARWQCVRKHAANLQDDSWFFTRGNQPDQAWGITFNTLWLSWASDFGKKYDIPDSWVKQAIYFNGSNCNRNVAQLKISLLRESVDYDLDNEKSYVKPKPLSSAAPTFKPAAPPAVKK